VYGIAGKPIGDKKATGAGNWGQAPIFLPRPQGEEGIPASWRSKIAHRESIESFADRLEALARKRIS